MVELALDVDLFSAMSTPKKLDQLFSLTRESFERHRIDDLWRATKATSPASLTQVLLSEHVTQAIRNELRRQTRHRVEPDDIVRLLRETIIRPECLEA